MAKRTIKSKRKNPAEWLTPHEAAAYLELSYSTLAHYRSQGGGPIFYKFGWRVAYAEPDLIAWQNGQRWSSTSNKLKD